MDSGTAVADRAVAFPGSVREALDAMTACPQATLVAGGTEVMTLVNSGALRPSCLVVLDRIEELRGVWFGDQEIVLGSATTCADLMQSDVRGVLPALAQAARSIASPGVRSRATLGGNLLSGKRPGGPAAAAPTRDLLTVLVALNAVAVCRSEQGWRQLPVAELYARDGGVNLRPGELLTALRVPTCGGRQGFMKVGTRAGAARSLVTFALAADLSARTVTCAIGGFSPLAVRVDHAGQWLAEHVDWENGAIPDPTTYPRFARLIAEGLVVPGSAGPAGRTTVAVPQSYREQAAEVCARRALVRALPPAGWLEQVAQYQQRAEFVRNRARVERAERGLPPEPPVPGQMPGAQPPGGGLSRGAGA
ncbi:FAD binding domain-containing protein [Actinocrinis puniceicyclus]|uniref:FAD binding domain-containing protein n=1 Tax=Actinocrinis puniceicyclus TaxID=977794 RepID=A0A8J7WS17_9ACTN|nr:FAD binding domain-containing protein [Actinocrinis puniceicyclus]MBS2964545.1 FAD binding domain-containing protein [Actinocrinis puniceicyclus]